MSSGRVDERTLRPVDVDRRADRPLYLQLADVIRAQIHDGHFPPGERLPSESTLIASHDVSRGTVRDAIGVLRSEGLVVVEHGRGAYVRDQTPVVYVRHLARYPDLTFADAFTADATSQGLKPSIRSVDPAMLDGLEPPPHPSVDGMLCFVDGRVVQAAITWTDRPGQATVEERVQTRMPTRSERRLLQLDDGVPVLEVRRRAIVGGVQEHAWAILPADRVHLTVSHEGALQ